MKDEKTPEETGSEAEGTKRFGADMDKLREDLEARFHRHLEDGQPVAAMEARLLARLIEGRKFDTAKEWATEYQGSLDSGL